MKQNSYKWRIGAPRLMVVVTALGLLLLLAACGAAPGPTLLETELTGRAANSGNLANSPESAAAVASGNNPANATPTISVQKEEVAYDEFGVEVGFTAEGRPYRGSPNAPVLLEEFSDYQCPFCARFSQQTRPNLLRNQIANGEVVLVLYDFPLTSIHPQGVAAAHAARCAGEQGAVAYWAMHERLFATINSWSNGRANEVFALFAKELGLDESSFRTCQESGRYNDAINADINLGMARGVRSTPTFFLNNQILIGAQPLESFNSAIALVKGGQPLPTEAPPQAANPTPNPAIAPTPATIRLNDGALALGNPAAPVTLVEFTDYQCPFCARHVQQTMPQIISQLIETGRVYYIMKDFPLDQIHPQARVAAAAARCAGEQEADWAMHDLLFARQQNWSGQANVNAIFAGYATELGLNEAAFSDCLNSGRYDAAIEQNLQEGLSLGVRGTPAFFINGFPISGAQPYNLFEYAVGLAEEGTLAQAYVREPEPTPAPSGPLEVPIEGAYAIGDPNAPVVIVEFTDLQCPFCARHHSQTLPQIVANFVDKGLVYYVIRDFPLTSIHPQAVQAAEAARCAGDQGAFFAMYDRLFAQQRNWSGRADAAALFVEYAIDLGLNTTAFMTCLESQKYQTAVFADLELGSRLGVNGTPAFFINGYSLSGAQPYSTFVEAITYFLEQ